MTTSRRAPHSLASYWCTAMPDVIRTSKTKDNPLAEIRAAYKALGNDPPNGLTTMRALTALGSAIEEIQTLQIELARRGAHGNETRTYPDYTNAIGDAGYQYMRRCDNRISSGLFYWHELWDALNAAAHAQKASEPRVAYNNAYLVDPPPSSEPEV